MSRASFMAAGWLLSVVVLGGCAGYSTSSTPAPVASTAGSPSTVSGAGPASTHPTAASSIAIKDFAFSPQSLTVKAGTTVTTTNRDNTSHTWTATGGAFDSHDLTQGKSFAFTFTKAGTFRYVCSIHSSMTGTVIVTP